MAEMRATPYSNPFLGGVSGLVDALTGYLGGVDRTQQAQMVGNFIKETGIPKTLQRMAYGEPITNSAQANVPFLRPETGNAAMTLLGMLPVGAPAAKVLPKNLPVGMSIKSADGTIAQALSPTAPVSPAGFYSAAEQAALNLPRNKGTGQALLNDLLKGADVKRDELQATGVLDAFANRPQATKQELVDFLQANKIDVGETVKTSVNPFPYRTAGEWQGAIDAAEKNNDWDLADRLGTAWEQFEGHVRSKKIPRYESWALPGGENYREVLLTMPNQWEKPRALQEANSARIQQLRDQMYGTSGTDEIRGEISKLQNENQLLQKQINDAPIYKSSHWDEPNVMAHLRLNDRVDADGKKMTLIEELQSDWHQAGREMGYKTGKEKSPADIERELTVVTRKRSQLLQEAADLPDSEMARFKEMNAEIKRLGDEATRLNDEWTNALIRPEGVPDAPMKDTWYQTALRKAVKDAIDNGSDRVGIPTGSRIADRFGKGKYVESFDVGNVDETGAREVRFKIKDGGTVFAAIDKDGKIIEGNSNLIQPYMGKDLSKVIGKKATIKINSYGKEGGTFAMDGEMLGGQGMKQYYDETYPNYLDKFAKKYGSKVSDGSLAGTKSKDQLASQLYGRGETYKNLPSESKRQVDQMFLADKEPVRYIEITPEMRKALGGKDKGVPLFQAAPLIPVGIGAGGLLDQFGERQQ
jgi:hypothetical protein